VRPSSPGLSAGARVTLWRSLQTFTVTRIVIALVLLVYLGVDLEAGALRPDPVHTETCVFYVVAAALFALAARWQRRFLIQLGVQIGVDLAVISLLYIATGGMRSGLAILYLFPLAGAAILAPLLLALFSAAVATLFLLGLNLWQLVVEGRDPPLMQAGLFGAAFFAGVLMVNRLAARLLKQEELAAQRGADLRIQQAINEIVIADVGDGILVVGEDGAVFTGNPAARRMLGLADTSVFSLRAAPAFEPVALAFDAWLAAPANDKAFVTLKPYREGDGAGEVRGRRDQPVHLKLRFARVADGGDAAGRSVIFMQDVSAIENQAQQLKLASMGRLTASIAHEVRNPLSAIGHATDLLAEDLHGPAEVRLLKIVRDNVARVNRMVEDILQLSRKAQPNGEPVALGPFLEELKAEFCEIHGLAGDIVYIGDPGGSAVRFDPLHLHEVLLNLLNNAVRYASRQPASIRIFPARDAAGRRELHVQDDGPGITPEVRDHLFEPFYTTSSKGTGLGLYLARELCLNNDAKLDYEYRFDPSALGPRKASGRFVITFALD